MEKSTNSRKIYALFVGINKYHPSSGISNLYGCVGDIERMNVFLSGQISSSDRYQSKLLRNDQATRDEVIKEFRSHLGKATEEDVVLFMYAGHGSRQPSAVEFNDRYPDQMDETLVCYDSRLPSGFDLADKELAVLIAELNAAHVLVILDSCHSGSGTRNSDQICYKSFRHATSLKTPRLLNTYVDDHYGELIRQQGELSIPQRPHILLSACNRHEMAAEHHSGYGLFSNAMLTTLKAGRLGISYADLFLHCRIAIRKETYHQTPQFECYGVENPNASFLHTIDLGEIVNASLEVYREAGRWYINFGALHGALPGSKQTNAVALFRKGREIGLATLRGVGPERSELVMPSNIVLEIDQRIEGELRMFQAPPVMLYVDSAPETYIFFEECLPQDLNVQLTKEASEATYQIKVRDTRLDLIDMHAGQLLQYTPHVGKPGVVELFQALKRVLTWQRFRSLENVQMEPEFAKAEVEFCLYDRDRNKMKIAPLGSELSYYGKETDEVAYYPVFRVKNGTSQKLYFSLFYLSRKYGILFLDSRPVDSGSDWVTLWGKYDGNGLYLPKGVFENMDIFKVVISLEDVQTWLIAQNGIEVGEEVRGGLRDLQEVPFSSISCWVARTFDVKLQKLVDK